MRTLKSIIILVLSIIAGGNNARSDVFHVSDNDVRTILKRLDSELSKRSVYIENRREHIDSLSRAASTPPSRKTLLSIERLADEYNSFNNDSALYNYNRGYMMALETGDDSMATVFRLKEAMYMPLAGFISDAEAAYDSISPSTFPPHWHDVTVLYYDAGRQMYSYIAAFFINYNKMHDRYNQLSIAAQNQLLSNLDEHSLWYKLNQGEYYFYIREYSKSNAILLDLLERLPEDNNIYARASHILSEIAKARGEHNAYVYYLAKSAIADTKGATLEVTSLQELGQLLFSMDDIDRAHVYLSTALRNAVECHASMRMIESAEAMPIIESAHKLQLDAGRRRTYIIITAMAILLMALCATLIYLRRDIIKMRRMRQRLQDTNNIKDVYISQFLNLCSIYMDKLNQFCKIANRKISTGNVDDLYKITKSGKFVEEQSKDFYDVFDNAFLHIYPTFVTDVNKLLHDDAKIKLRDDELLNTDLRILAFMRLGIDESTRIAQVLNYSVYTIYAYRNKLKNRAINRETFEEDIMQIGSLS